MNSPQLLQFQSRDGKIFVKNNPSKIYSGNMLEDHDLFQQFLLKTDLLHRIKLKGFKTIYIKPNFMTYIHRDGLCYTSILLLRSLCEFLKQAGLKTIIVESDMFYKSVFPKHTVENVSRKLGINFAPVLNMSTQPVADREFKGKHYLIPAIFNDSQQYFLINFPKLKGHPIFHFTCALKNVYGLFPEQDKIYFYHHEMDICDAIIAVNHLIKTDFTLVDAIKCQDRIHDVLTTALPVKDRNYFYAYRHVFASENPLAIDMLIKDLLNVGNDCVLDAMQAIYEPTYSIIGDQPSALTDFEVSGYFKRSLWRTLTEFPYSREFLHSQMRKIFRKRIKNPKYLFDEEIFQID